jgi:Pentapeptide repeats (8 copies)
MSVGGATVWLRVISLGSDLRGSRFDRADLSGARFWASELSGARFQGVDMSRVVMRGVELADVEITGEIVNVTINGVDIAPLVEAEPDRRDPERAKMRPEDPAGFREDWQIPGSRMPADRPQRGMASPSLCRA